MGILNNFMDERFDRIVVVGCTNEFTSGDLRRAVRLILTETLPTRLTRGRVIEKVMRETACVAIGHN